MKYQDRVKQGTTISLKQLFIISMVLLSKKKMKMTARE